MFQFKRFSSKNHFKIGLLQPINVILRVLGYTGEDRAKASAFFFIGGLVVAPLSALVIGGCQNKRSFKNKLKDFFFFSSSAGKKRASVDDVKRLRCCYNRSSGVVVKRRQRWAIDRAIARARAITSNCWGNR